MPESPADTVAAARRILALAVQRGGDTVEPDGMASAAAYFDELDQLLADVRLAHSLMSRALGQAMRDQHVDRLDRDGFPPIECHGSKSRTNWDSDQLRTKVVGTLRALASADTSRLAVDPATGERSVATFEQAVEGLAHVYSLSGSTARVGKVPKSGAATGLRSLGIDPDDYCDGGPERPVITAQVIR